MITFELSRKEKVTISSDDKDLIISVKESNKFPFKDGEYLASSTTNGWTWFYVFKEFKDNTIYFYTAILNSNLGHVYTKPGNILLDDIKKTVLMSGPEARAFVSVYKANGFRWNYKDKVVEEAFKVGDIVKTISSDRYYLIQKINGIMIHGVEADGYVSVVNMNNLNYTIEQEVNLFFEDLHKNGLEYDAINNVIQKIKWIPKEGEKYYWITAYGTIGQAVYNAKESWQIGRIQLNNYFQTGKEASNFLLKVKELYKNRI